MRSILRRIGFSLAGVVLFACIASAQTATVIRNVNLRPEQSSVEPAIRLLTPDEPPLSLLEPHLQDGYYHVRTSKGEEGYVYGRNVQVSSARAAI